MHTQHLALPPHYSSPSSQGSESIGTPPMDHMSFNNPENIKRPSSSIANSNASGSRKKVRKDEEDESTQSLVAEKEEGKAKPTRGARYAHYGISFSLPTHSSLQSLYCVSPPENEVRRCGTRATLQTLPGRKSPMCF
jgi:hypothetical protein